MTALLAFISCTGWKNGMASSFGMRGEPVRRHARRRRGEAEAEEPAERREAAVALAERAGRVEHDVDAAAAGDALHLDLEVLACGSRSCARRPASRSTACLLADAVPITSAPASRQSWIAAMPTPPAAAWTSTRSPAFTLPKWRSMRTAVR